MSYFVFYLRLLNFVVNIIIGKCTWLTVLIHFTLKAFALHIWISESYAIESELITSFLLHLQQ